MWDIKQHKQRLLVFIQKVIKNWLNTQYLLHCHERIQCQFQNFTQVNTNKELYFLTMAIFDFTQLVKYYRDSPKDSGLYEQGGDGNTMKLHSQQQQLYIDPKQFPIINLIITQKNIKKVYMQEEQKNKRQQEQVRRNNDQINIVFKRDIFLTPLMKNQLKNIDVCQFIIQNMFKSPITIKKQLEQIKQLFNSISQWRIVCLIVNGTDGANLPIPTILKQIQNIKFHQLIRLNLWKCQIQTIQNLSIIQMPELQQLWLDSNYIISIKSLIRCHLPKLKQLSIRNNFIVECQDLCLIYLSKLQIIVLEYWGQDRDICKMTNLIKIQSPAINQIHTQSQSKIKQDNIVNKLFNKFSHEQINIYGGYHI